MKIVNSLKVFQHYSYLLQQLVSRDFKVKYKRSVLGVAWSVLNPLFTMIILNLVFSTLFAGKFKTVIDYPIYLLTGLVLFNYFSEATNLSNGAIVTNFNLLTKIYIPKYIFPLSKTLSSAVNLLFSFIALYVIFIFEILMGVKGVYFSPTHFLLIFDVICFVAFTIGVSMILSALTVFFRDMFYIWGVVLTAWNYLTPIMYPAEIVNNYDNVAIRTLMQTIFTVNPLYYYVDYARKVVLYNQVPDLMTHLLCIGIALLSLLLGTLFFRSKQDKFIYHI